MRKSKGAVMYQKFRIWLDMKVWAFIHPCDHCGKRILFAKSEHGAYDTDWIHTRCKEEYGKTL